MRMRQAGRETKETAIISIRNAPGSAERPIYMRKLEWNKRARLARFERATCGFEVMRTTV